jgi:heat shock protein HtpX
MHQQIINNKRKTFAFIFGFIMLIGIVSYLIGEILGGGDPFFSYLILIIGLLFSLVGSFFSYYFSDKIILKMAGAVPVDKSQEPFLYNTIEGVAMAAGIPTPKMYVIENAVPNAFATGRNPQNGVVAVTRGLLELMNREELEGVIAHEIGHIKNYDILYATVVSVMVGLLVFISRMFTRSMFYGGMRGGNRRNRDSKGGGNAIILVVGLVFIIISPIFAQMLQFAMSRNREYLADATAASLLGYPLGLASALEKLQSKNTPKIAKENDFDNNAITALCIVNPLKSGKIENIFSTHPALDKRIERLKKM